MKRYWIVLVLIVLLSSCEPTDDIKKCDEGYKLVDDNCVLEDEEPVDQEEPVEEIIYPEPIVTIINIDHGKTEFEIVIPENEYNLEIVGLNLVKGSTKQIISNLMQRVIINLDSDTDYALEYKYTHDSADGTSVIESTKSVLFTTEVAPKVVPSVDLITIGTVSDRVTVRIEVNDPDELVFIGDIKLVVDDIVVDTYEYEPLLVIEKLELLTKYKLIVEYSYDLGEGSISESETLQFTSSSPVVEYFIDIALGFEFGSATKITRKWVEPMKIYVDGSPTEELLEELDNIILELNDLFTDGFYMEIVNTKSESNFQVVMSSAEFYQTNYGVSATYTNTNWGLFYLWWDNNDNLNRGHMYVDIYRPNLAGQKHLLREELTQALGLAKDSYEYPNSIFQQAWTTTNSYAEIDKSLIWLLYNPKVKSGLTENQTRELLIAIVKQGLPNHN